MLLACLVPDQTGVRKTHPQFARLCHRSIDEFLPQGVVADALDAPAHRLRRVGRLLIWWAKHHDRRPPPAVHSILNHRPLRLGALAHHGQQGLVALALMKTFFAANTHHGPGIGCIGTAAQRDLVHDRSTIHQPADGAHVGPGQGGVVEDRAVLGPPVQQGVCHVPARGAQGFGCGIQVEAVAGLVLYLGQQDGLALEGGRTGNPVALGQHAHHLRVRMLADLAHQGLAVVLGHRVLGLDEFTRRNAGFETLLGLHRLGADLGLAPRNGLRALGVHCLCVHGWLL